MIEYYKRLKTFVICNGERCCAWDCGNYVQVVDQVSHNIVGCACHAGLDNGNMQPGIMCPCKDKDDVMVVFNMHTGGSGGA